MIDNNPTEDSNRSNWKVSVLIFVFLLLLCLGVYFLIFSPSFANNQNVILIRQNYLSIAYSIRKYFNLPKADNCSYFYQPIWVNSLNSSGVDYTYSISGKLVEIDLANNTIGLLCSNNKTYKMAISIEQSGIPGSVVIKSGVGDPDTNGQRHFFTFYSKDISKSGEIDPYYKENGYYTLVWNDDRTLRQIYSDMRKNPDIPVNINYHSTVGLLR